MSGVRRINAYRYAGVIESGYLMDDFDVEIIADGHHLPASLLKLIYKVKGSSHICLVTDSINAAGLPEGTESKIGSVEFIVENGVAKLLDRSAFAGSVTCANRLLKTMVELAGVPICEAVKMLTLTPARISGVDDRMGSLVPGKTANITVFDKDYSVSHVFVRGKLVYGND
jgi:N-acetylglucosamine-6-phosphate deacetylase